MNSFEFQQHGFRETGEQLAPGIGHVGNLHHLPSQILPKLHDAALDHMHPVARETGIEILGVAPVDHQTRPGQQAGIDAEALGKTGHPDHHIGFSQGLMELKHPARTELRLEIQQRLGSAGHQQQFPHPLALEPAAHRAADISGGSNHRHPGAAQIDAQPRRVVHHLLGDHPGGVGVTRGEPLPLQLGIADLLFLEEVEILENDRSETAQGGDRDVVLLGELHGAKNLSLGRLKAAQHLRHEHRIDIGSLNNLAGGASHRDRFNQLRRGDTPHLEIALGILRIAEAGGHGSSGIKAGGVTDQAKHDDRNDWIWEPPDQAEKPSCHG